MRDGDQTHVESECIVEVTDHFMCRHLSPSAKGLGRELLRAEQKFVTASRIAEGLHARTKPLSTADEILFFQDAPVMQFVACRQVGNSSDRYFVFIRDAPACPGCFVEIA